MKWTLELDAALVERYETHTRREIADELGLTEGQVRSRFCTLGMAGKVRPWSDGEVAKLIAAYSGAVLHRDIDLPGLAKSLGRDKANVCRKARELGLTNQRRQKLQAEEKKVYAPRFNSTEERSAHTSAQRKRWIAENGHPRGALGMRHTEETKAAISKLGRQRWESMSQEEKDELVLKRVKAKRDKGTPFPNPRGTWKAAWREIGGQRCFFRSRWEANYARYLEWLKSIGQIKSWEHEPHTFWFEGIKRGVVSYLPDFRVIECSGAIQWHEVKGWMDSRSKTCIARMAKYHPEEVLIVIQEKQYNEIKRKVSSLVPGWES